MTRTLKEVGALLAAFIWLVFLVFMADLELGHEHTELRYVMRGRLHTDTLCRTDTMLVWEGEHRPVPEILEEVVWGELDRPQPIIEKPLD